MRSLSTITARWAAHNEQLSVDNGRKPKSYGRYGNCSYDGRRYYSYSTCVAVYCEGRGGQYVILTNHNYSLSTNRHISYARCATHVPTFKLPYLEGDTISVEENAKYLAARLETYAKLAVSKWRTWAYNDHNVEAELPALHDDLCEFCGLTGASVSVEPLFVILNNVMAERKRLRDKFHDPKAVAKRERTKARKLAKELLIQG